MKYKVGDKVRIREWEDMAQEYGACGGCIRPPKGAAIVSIMEEFCGRETIIKHGSDFSENYKLEIDEGRWSWPECALLPAEEPATEVPPKQIAYISGPITGIENYRKAFAHAKELLTEKGYSAINPANLYTVLPESAVYEDYMAICMLLVEKADVLVLLPGWEKSLGANREMGYAKGLGKKIIALEELCKTTNTDGTQS